MHALHDEVFAVDDHVFDIGIDHITQGTHHNVGFLVQTRRRFDAFGLRHDFFPQTHQEGLVETNLFI